MAVFRTTNRLPVFQWHTVDPDNFPNVHIPYLVRNDSEKHMCVRIIEKLILSEYVELTPEVLELGHLKSVMLEAEEIAVLNDLNEQHMEGKYGPSFTSEDQLVELEHFNEFYTVLKRTGTLRRNLNNRQQQPQPMQHPNPPQPLHHVHAAVAPARTNSPLEVVSLTQSTSHNS